MGDELSKRNDVFVAIIYSARKFYRAITSDRENAPFTFSTCTVHVLRPQAPRTCVLCVWHAYIHTCKRYVWRTNIRIRAGKYRLWTREEFVRMRCRRWRREPKAHFRPPALHRRGPLPACMPLSRVTSDDTDATPGETENTPPVTRTPLFINDNVPHAPHRIFTYSLYSTRAFERHVRIEIDRVDRPWKRSTRIRACVDGIRVVVIHYDNWNAAPARASERARN